MESEGDAGSRSASFVRHPSGESRLPRRVLARNEHPSHHRALLSGVRLARTDGSGRSLLELILHDLARQLDRILDRNRFLERQLEMLTGLRPPESLSAGRQSRAPGASTSNRRKLGAPRRFTDEQALALRTEYEAGATAVELAKKFNASLPTILSTLRRAGTRLRRGRRKTRQ